MSCVRIEVGVAGAAACGLLLKHGCLLVLYLCISVQNPVTRVSVVIYGLQD